MPKWQNLQLSRLPELWCAYLWGLQHLQQNIQHKYSSDFNINRIVLLFFATILLLAELKCKAADGNITIIMKIMAWNCNTAFLKLSILFNFDSSKRKCYFFNSLFLSIFRRIIKKIEIAYELKNSQKFFDVIKF